MTRATELESAEMEEKKILAKIFDRIDDDGSGAVTYDELLDGAKKVAEFRHWLRVLDIDGRDLEQLFSIVDEDGSGEIDPTEFIEAMYRIKNAESKTATRFVKHQVTKLHEEQQKFQESMQSRIEDTAAMIQQQEAVIHKAMEIAMSKASQVALEAALDAASKAARQVLSTVASSSGQLAERMERKIRHTSEWKRQVSANSDQSSQDGNRFMVAPTVPERSRPYSPKGSKSPGFSAAGVDLWDHSPKVHDVESGVRIPKPHEPIMAQGVTLERAPPPRGRIVRV
eukprot:CAMPEP_0117490016 /NCGR_PEP_ID=MMETSP0784-20121206/17335_1 /TAXON_ID=39447 /ORGANISM="" /LENGTH=283 /DNA_ID=CAMNT_0005284765 /DNA_START=19 /DNA_END=870 /DNA_ORIENTATION=+